MANNDGHDNTNKNHIPYNHMIIAVVISVMLLSSTFAVFFETGAQEAYADKGGKSGSKGSGGNSSSDHDNNSDKGKSNDKSPSKNNTSTTNSNEEEKSKTRSGSNDEDHSNKGQKSDHAGKQGNNPNLVKAEKLKPQKLGNETVSWPFSANTTYFLDANGTAQAIGDKTTTNVTSVSAELSAEMSIWKTTKSLVSMEVKSGSIITVDGKAMEFYSGQAQYLPNKHKMLLVGFIIEGHEDHESEIENDGGTGDNQTGIDDTGATNQTSTETISDNEEGIGEEAENGEDGPALKHIKLWILVTGQDESIPSEGSSDSMSTIQILSPQSKIASEWFLQMNGELYASP